MSKVDVLKFQLKNIPTMPLELITRAWIELVLDRNDSNRTNASIDLGISQTKIRDYINKNKVVAKSSPAGRRKARDYP
jgi:transcriptional regulator with AAA-type ATPase domain